MRRQLKVKQKQAGRKPKRLGIPSKKDWKKKQRKAYSGNSDGKKNRQLWKRKRKEGFAMFVHWKQSSVCRIWATSRQSAAVPRVTWVA